MRAACCLRGGALIVVTGFCLRMEAKLEEVFVAEVWPYCLIAGQEEEINVRFSWSFERSRACQIYFLHHSMLPQETVLDIHESSAP